MTYDLHDPFEYARTVQRFAARESAASRSAIVGWRQRRPVEWHAALAVGIEGRQDGSAFTPHALLLLDAAGSEPGLARFNARIDMHGHPSACDRSRAIKRAVTIEGVVSIRSLADTHG